MKAFMKKTVPKTQKNPVGFIGDDLPVKKIQNERIDSNKLDAKPIYNKPKVVLRDTQGRFKHNPWDTGIKIAIAILLMTLGAFLMGLYQDYNTWYCENSTKLNIRPTGFASCPMSPLTPINTPLLWFTGDMPEREPVVDDLYQWVIDQREPAQESTKSAAIKEEPVPSINPNALNIVNWMRKKESGYGTAGLAVTCKNRGMWNEVGWRAEAGFCFTDENEGMHTVITTIAQRLDNKPLKEVLCVYNMGYNKDENGNRIPWDDCEYYQDFIKSL